MVLPKVKNRETDLWARCDFVGGSKDDILQQITGFSIDDLTIAPNPDDNSYCWYKFGDQFIDPVDFKTPPFTMGSSRRGVAYTFFNKGITDKLNPLYAQFKDSSDIVVTEFIVIETGNKDYFGGHAEALRHTFETYISEKFSGENNGKRLIEVNVFLDRTVDGLKRYKVYLATMNVDHPYAIVKKDNRPELVPSSCPEWFMHTQNLVKGDISLDGWELMSQGQDTYIAIPRQELQEDIKQYSGRIGRYRYDLSRKLGTSDYIKGDETVFRYYSENEILIINDDGVEAMYCPAFEVKIHEVRETPQTCLELIERKRRGDIRGEIMIHENGYLLAGKDENERRYITSTPNADLEIAKQAFLKTFTDSGNFVVKHKRISNDGICELFELTALNEGGSPTTKAMSTESGGTPNADIPDLVPQVVGRAIEQGKGDIKDKDVDIVFVVDHSGSMERAAELARDSIRGIISSLRSSNARKIKIGLVLFNDQESIEMAMPLGDANESNIQQFFSALKYLKFTGGFEPVGIATKEAFNYFSLSEPDTLKQIVVITDNDGLSDDEKYFSFNFNQARINAGIAGIAINLKNLYTNETVQRSIVPYDLISALASVGDDNAIQTLLGMALRSDFGDTRKEAANALLRMGPQAGKAIEILARSNSVDESFRLKAASSILELNKGKGLDAVLTVGLRTPDQKVKSTARKLISQSEMRQMAERDLRNIVNTSYFDDSLRINAALELALMGDREAKKFITDLSVGSMSPKAKEDAAKALIRLKKAGK